MRKIGLIIGIFALIILAGCVPKPQDGKYAQIAQCLTEKGVKFYGAFWCPHCNDQKKLFGSDIRYITYVECDPKGANANPQDCKEAGVGKYPTWFFPGQGNVTGVQEPEALAKKANCEAAGTQSTTTQTTTETQSTQTGDILHVGMEDSISETQATTQQ